MNRPLDGYPGVWGSQRASVFPVTGPDSYTTYVAPSTGGQDVQVSGPAGVKTIDFAIGGVSESGLYRAEVVQIESSDLNGVTLARTQLVLKWYTIATGAAVNNGVDLSGETVNILVIGPK
jgi:hypothetical protein